MLSVVMLSVVFYLPLCHDTECHGTIVHRKACDQELALIAQGIID